MKLRLLIGFLIFWSVCGFAQTPQKRHPRVVEIEKTLQTDIQNSLRDMIAGQSFHVKVTVDPLHRQTSSVSGKESLPYYEANDEIKDEWDDPNRSDQDLLARVNRISVKAVVPATISLDLVNEIKTVIRNRIPFVENRDLVEVEQKMWSVPPTGDHSQYTTWILGIGLVMMFLLGVVFFVVSTLATSRLAKAIRNIKITTSESESVGGGGMSASAMASTNTNQSGLGSGQLQLNDTIRMTEAILRLIKNFESSRAFPNLDDMVLFEQYFQTAPQSMGALLSEFPLDLKYKVFSYSFSESWLKGLTDPGEVDHICFELMNKLMRVERTPDKLAWNELLTVCWRLEGKLVSFLKKVDPKESLLILKSLPQSLGIKAARELMPGQWASILNRSQDDNPLSIDRIDKLKQLALDHMPLRSWSLLDQYKKDMDLIKYLRQSDPSFEKEIYGAIPADSTLHKIRPPFYAVLDAPAGALVDFCNQVTLDDWALALLNVPRTIRGTVTGSLTDKQKIRLQEILRKLDRSPVSIEMIGVARERIGKLFFEHTQQQEAQQNVQPELSAKEAA